MENPDLLTPAARIGLFAHQAQTYPADNLVLVEVDLHTQPNQLLYLRPPARIQ